MRRTAILLSALLVFSAQAQTDSLSLFKKRKIALLSGSLLLTTGSLAALNQAWYAAYSTGRFHFFDDNKEWLQMDKLGHTYSTYQTSRMMMQAFDWAGFNKKMKLLVGGGTGFIYMTAIEIMDGYSKGWGFSWGDQLCDALGSGLAIAQELKWQKQKIQFKFSYAQSGLAQYNPSLLGDSPASRLLKDYNGQTYWLSINPSSFKELRWLPLWLNLALGYSAYGMIGGHENRRLAQGKDGTVYQLTRERRWYLSLDVDLTRIRTNKKWLRTVFSVVNILKFPAPAIQFASGKWRFYGIYY